jgi:hypothetical protein
MTASKRKNDDASILQGMTKMVIVDVNNNGSSNVNFSGNEQVQEQVDSKVFATIERMKQLMAEWRQEEEDHKSHVSVVDNDDGNGVDFHHHFDDSDPIAYAIRAIGERDIEPEETLLRESEHIHSDFDRQLQQEKDLCRQESSELSNLAEKLEQYRTQRAALLQEIDELDERQRIAQQNIATYVDEASQELEQIDECEEERKRQVPRLKTTISLYASTTGIKWDFKEGTDVLSGQVVRLKRRNGRRVVLYFLLMRW